MDKMNDYYELVQKISFNGFHTYIDAGTKATVKDWINKILEEKT